MTEHADCIFCSPAPDAEVFRNADGIVLLDEPARPGHVLVGIHTHSPSLHDADPAEVAKMMQLAASVSQTIVAATGAEKTYVVAIGDKDKHFHVHLIPKMADDPPLGPHVFSGDGWARFLQSEVDATSVESVSAALRAQHAA